MFPESYLLEEHSVKALKVVLILNHLYIENRYSTGETRNFYGFQRPKLLEVLQLEF
jgi:hypothetical protein